MINIWMSGVQTDVNRVYLEDFNGKKNIQFMDLILIFGNSKRLKVTLFAAMEFMMTKTEFVTNIKE